VLAATRLGIYPHKMFAKKTARCLVFFVVEEFIQVSHTLDGNFVFNFMEIFRKLLKLIIVI
jgi:hypothetical protein